MANLNADNAANMAATPPTRIKANKQHGRLRIFEATATVPATGGPGIGEKITWGKLPKGARVLGNMGLLSFSAGAATSTLNLGDAASDARHLAATSVAAAGTAVPQAQSAAGASFETSDDSGGATDNCTLVSTVAGAALGAGQVITLRVPFTLD